MVLTSAALSELGTKSDLQQATSLILVQTVKEQTLLAKNLLCYAWPLGYKDGIRIRPQGGVRKEGTYMSYRVLAWRNDLAGKTHVLRPG